jgi:UDP-GlcNAc3NAcA epimerase
VRILSVVGARPQFIKIAPLCRAIEARVRDTGEPIEHLIVHTGQHYDDAMSTIFFDELRIPRPALNLDIGSGSHGDQTGRMLIALEKVMIDSKPDVVVVYGDTNSTLAGTIAASKLRIAVAHVESGLRSFNRAMPEEINRIVADHLSDLLFAPTPTAMAHLQREGRGAQSVLTGDVSLDAVQFNRTLAKGSAVFRELGLAPGAYALATIHRAENTSPEPLLELMELLEDISKRYWPIVLPLHPRTKNVLQQGRKGWRAGGRLHTVEPVGYLENLYLIEHARIVLTDSGGLQKEAYFLNCPCVTLRGETEWTETVDSGANVVTGTARAAVLGAVEQWEARLAKGRPDFAPQVRKQFGDGRASHAMVRQLIEFCDSRQHEPRVK